MNPEDTHHVLAEIYRTGYFTNHGPQAKKLEQILEGRFGARNAVIVSNESLAVVMALSGLGLTGRVAVPPAAPAFLHHSIQAAGLIPTSSGDNTVAPSAHLIYCQWGDAIRGDIAGLGETSSRQKIVYAMGNFPVRTHKTPQRYSDDIVTIGIVGDGGHEPSIHCAFILTNDDCLAEKYRNIRSSYGARKIVDVTATANGRVSEFQAGLALRFFERRSAPNRA